MGSRVYHSLRSQGALAVSKRPTPFREHSASKANTTALCITSPVPFPQRRKDSASGVINSAPHSLQHLRAALGFGSRGVRLMPQIREVAGQARWPLRPFTMGLGIEGPRAGSCKREGKQPCVPSLPLRDHGKGKERPGAEAQEGGEGKQGERRWRKGRKEKAMKEKEGEKERQEKEIKKSKREEKKEGNREGGERREDGRRNKGEVERKESRKKEEERASWSHTAPLGPGSPSRAPQLLGGEPRRLARPPAIKESTVGAMKIYWAPQCHCLQKELKTNC